MSKSETVALVDQELVAEEDEDEIAEDKMLRTDDREDWSTVRVDSPEPEVESIKESTETSQYSQEERGKRKATIAVFVIVILLMILATSISGYVIEQQRTYLRSLRNDIDALNSTQTHDNSTR